MFLFLVLMLSHKCKPGLRVVLTGHAATIVTYTVKSVIVTCFAILPIFYAVIVASTEIQSQD